MSDVKITLLGAPEVEHLGRHLAFPDRKTLALFAYLATEGGIHERQKLTRLLWPESDSAHGRTSLRIALLRLRQVLKEETLSGFERHLIIMHDKLGLDRSSGVDIDLHVLEEAWRLVQKLPPLEAVQGEVRRTVISQLQRAAALYRGSFLEGLTLRDVVDFENWVSMQRGYWSHRVEQVFDRLSQLQGAEGAIEQAIETVERWRSFDPLNEDMYLRLMQLQLATGNRVTALKTYETCVDILRKELHAKPSRQLIALAESIRNIAPAHHKSNRMRSGRHADDGRRTLLHIPFVGRGAELSQLMALYEQASQGRPQIVLVEGETGSGKSHLAAAFLDWAQAQGAGVLAGQAYKTHQRLSYQPLLDSLRAWVEREPDLHKWLSSIWLAELSRLLPELRERYPDLPAPTADEVFASARLLEALARLGQAWAEQRSLLICIDDIQWTDEATLDALHYLFRHWTQRSLPALLLLVRRTETRSIDSRLAEGFANLKSVAPLTRLELGPLSKQDLLQIVRSFSSGDGAPPAQPGAPFLFPTDLSSQHQPATGDTLSLERLCNWLFEETGGQPFYTMAVLEALLERDGLKPRLTEEGKWVLEPQATLLQDDGPEGIIPSNVREMVQSRLARLSPAARELLAAGAVLDHDFSFEDLCQIAHLPLQEGLAALDEAMEHLLLRETGGKSAKMGRSIYLFAHDKIREVVYSEVGEARRRIFHSRALQALEQSGVSAAELVYHALASGATDSAFRWSVVAGDEAMKVFAIRNAIGHYEQARQLKASHEVQIPISVCMHLFLQLGRAYEHCNNAQAAQATYQAMLETARELQEPAMECAALTHLAVLLSEDFSQLEKALALLQDALEVAERIHNQAALAEAQWGLARVHYYILDLDASLVHGRQAYALACELGQQDLIAKCLNILAYTTRALGQWEEAATIAEEARQLSMTRGDRMMEADCLSRIADAQINCGQPYEGVAAARSAYAISREIEHPWGQANSGYQLACGLVETGAYEEALTIALQSTEVARSLTFNILLFVNLLALGLVYQALLLPEQALQVHLEGLEVSKLVPSQRYIGLSFSLLCVDATLAGEREAASHYAQRMLETRDPRVVVCPEVARWPETEALLHADLSKQAAATLHAFHERFGTNKRCHLIYLRAQAALSQSQGDYDRAQVSLQEAIVEAKALGLPGELWQAESALGRLHLACGEPEQAAQAFARASVILEKLAQAITSEELHSHFLQRLVKILSHSMANAEVK